MLIVFIETELVLFVFCVVVLSILKNKFGIKKKEETFSLQRYMKCHST